MIATSESAAPTAMTSAARIATLKGNASAAPGARESPSPLLTNRKTKTGSPSVPITPIGSRMKTLISTQVSFQSPVSMAVSLESGGR